MARILGIAAATATALAALAVQPAAAQIAVEGNVAKVDGDWGGELGIGLGIPLVPGLVTLRAGGGGFLNDGEGDATDIDLYARAEASVAVSPAVSVGAGVRLGNTLEPYGTVAVPLAPLIDVKGNIGPDYLAAGLRLGF